MLHHIVNPLLSSLGYRETQREEAVITREGPEDAGYLSRASTGHSFGYGRLDPTPISTRQRDEVRRRASAQYAGPSEFCEPKAKAPRIVTNGGALRLILCDPAGPDSQIVVALTGSNGWLLSGPRRNRFDLFGAGLARRDRRDPETFSTRPDCISQRSPRRCALRRGRRSKISCNASSNSIGQLAPRFRISHALATGAYGRLPPVVHFKLESSAEPGGGFGFAASETLASRAFAEPGSGTVGAAASRSSTMIRAACWRMACGFCFRFAAKGWCIRPLSIAALGGGLFDPAATEALDGCIGGSGRLRYYWIVCCGPRRAAASVNECITAPWMSRYWAAFTRSFSTWNPLSRRRPMLRIRRGRWKQSCPRHRCTRALARKSPPAVFILAPVLGADQVDLIIRRTVLSGYLVHETLTPLVSPSIDAGDPEAILRIRVFDPAMGSGHFLVEACRFLADALYEACRRCDASGNAEDP